MMRVSRFGPIVLLVAAMTAAPVSAGSVTVGSFYVRLAQAKQLAAGDAAAAEAQLRGAGFELPRLVLDKGLNEGDLTAISESLGVSVTTQRPSQPISESLLNTYFSVFAPRLGAPTPGSALAVDAGGNDQGDDNNDQGKPPKSRTRP